MYKNIRSNCKFYFILAIAIFIINMLCSYNLSISNKLYAKGNLQESTGVLENIEEATVVTQTFIAIDDNLEKISIDFEPYKDSINYGGNLILSVENDNGEVLYTNTISRNYIRENSTYLIKFKKQPHSKDKQYKINVKFDDLQDYDAFYTLKYTTQNEFSQNKLFINGNELSNSSLIFQDFYKSPERVYIYYGIMIPLNIIAIAVSIIIYKKKNIKIENVFLIIAFVVCIFFLISMPTFKNHDEYYHWIKAYEVSIGNLVTPIENGIQGSNMPEGVSKIFPSDWTTMTYKDVQKNLQVKLNSESSGILSPETSAVYSFIQ